MDPVRQPNLGHLHLNLVNLNLNRHSLYAVHRRHRPLNMSPLMNLQQFDENEGEEEGEGERGREKQIFLLKYIFEEKKTNCAKLLNETTKIVCNTK